MITKIKSHKHTIEYLTTLCIRSGIPHKVKDERTLILQGKRGLLVAPTISKYYPCSVQITFGDRVTNIVEVEHGMD